MSSMQANSEDLAYLDQFDSDPLASVRRASGRLNQATSTAMGQAADNLLDKALARLERADPGAARPYVERALKLPFDDFEEAIPAVWAAHMRLFTAISDDLEGCEEGDHGWLRRAEILIERSSPVAATEVRNCLRSLRVGLVSLSSSETKKLKQLTSGIPLDAEPLADIGEGTARVDAIIEVLRAVLDHEAMLEEA
jgi:hypothetical protein